jgi:aminopeptidase N
VRTALLGADGQPLPLRLRGQAAPADGQYPTELVLRFSDAEREFVFEGVGAARPVPSLLRGFSAPVRLTVHGQTDADLLFLLAHDTDPFNRYEAGQVLAKKLLMSLYESVTETQVTAGGPVQSLSLSERLAAAGGVSVQLVDAFRALLTDQRLDSHFKSYALSLPSESELVDEIDAADPVLVSQVRSFVFETLARELRPEWEAAVRANDDPADKPYDFNSADCARRSLKNKVGAV